MQILAFIFRYAGVGEPAHVGMRADKLIHGTGAAARHASDKNKLVFLARLAHFFPTQFTAFPFLLNIASAKMRRAPILG